MIIQSAQWLPDNAGWFVNDNTWIMNEPTATGYDDVQRWIAAGNTPDPPDPVDEWAQIRTEREILLRQTDWTQAADAPLSTGQRRLWQVYRQALRDLPERYSDPARVVWPVAPG